MSQDLDLLLGHITFFALIKTILLIFDIDLFGIKEISLQVRIVRKDEAFNDLHREPDDSSVSGFVGHESFDVASLPEQMIESD